MNPIDKQKYFELLSKAENDPNCGGVVVSKKRATGVQAANMEYASFKIKEGKSFGIAVREENQSYIDMWIRVMKNTYGLDVQYRKLYSIRFTEDGIFEDKNKFIGYELFLNNLKVD